MTKFLVILKKDSAAENIFSEDHDATIKGLLVISCESFDASGSHLASLKRIPVGKNQDRQRISHQLWWIAYLDIAAVFEFDGKSNPVGFSA
jgi:hypothetical protein